MASLASTSQYPSGRHTTVYTVQLQRNLAVASNYVESPVSIPAGFTPTRLSVIGTAVSDASVSAKLAIGSGGYASTNFVAAFDVKGSSGVGQSVPSSALLLGAPLPFETVLGVTYTETGTGSTVGGPWSIVLEGIPGAG